MAIADYFQFEQIVCEILKRYLVDQGRSFEDQPRLPGRPEVDGWAPQGLDALPAPTLIEIKYRALAGEQRNTLERLRKVALQVGAKSVLLILGTPMTEGQEAALRGQGATWPDPPRFDLWTFERVQELMTRYAEYLPAAGPEVAQEGVRRIVDRGVAAADDWRAPRARALGELRQQYQAKRVVLFLGAGASHDAGVPDWNTLLHDLLLALVADRLNLRENLSPEEFDALVKALEGRPSSPLMMARDIRTGLQDRFPAEVVRALYRHVAPGATSRLLQEIARLCVDKVNAVVTYNFDDLLEQQLEAFGLQHRAVYREDQAVQEDELGVFHVHGFLPREGNREDLAESLLVFSEEGYHTIYGDPYSWSNVVQFGFLRERSCLLIGLSATDPNLRRLAEYAARRSRAPKHFILLKRYAPPPELFRSGEAVRLSEAFDRISHGLQEAAFRELGLTVIWFQEYAELPELLAGLRKS